MEKLRLLCNHFNSVFKRCILILNDVVSRQHNSKHDLSLLLFYNLRFIAIARPEGAAVTARSARGSRAAPCHFCACANFCACAVIFATLFFLRLHLYVKQ